MANWFYYDDNEQKQGPIDDRQLTILVTNRTILPETLIETEDGRQTKARKVKGLTFPPPPVPPDDTVSPENPFITPLPESKTGTSSTENLFTTPPSAAATPCPHCGEPVTAGETFCGSCGKSPGEPAAPGITADDDQPSSSGEFLGLLDIKFTRFITNWIIPIFWCLNLVFAIGGTFVNPILLFAIIEVTFNGAPFIDKNAVHASAAGCAFVLFVLQIPMLLWWLLGVRMFLEATMVFFRMEKHLRKMSGND
jgi:hypothetical protein